MSENGHTPGPWETRMTDQRVDGELDVGIVAHIDGVPRVIAEAFGRAAKTVRPDALANARLIAEAPNLLAACEGLVFEAELAPGPPHSQVRLDAARHAIAKARRRA